MHKLGKVLPSQSPDASTSVHLLARCGYWLLLVSKLIKGNKRVSVFFNQLMLVNKHCRL